MPEQEYYRVKLVMELHDRTQSALARMSAASRRVESTFARMRKAAQAFGRTVISPTVSIRDKATASLRLVRSAVKSLTGATWRLTLNVYDKVTGALGRIRRSLFSLKGLAVTVLAGLGLGKLGQATLGAAALWETQAVSMEHFLGGNKSAAAQVTAWLERFAAATPFEMSDLFPAMSRAIGITSGNVAMSQRLVKLAADMAGLTPGKTVLEAMEALADAQMGEFERMREFQMKMTQEQMKALGGFEGFLRAAESRFAGGAGKLAGTTVGLVSTITDNVKSLFRQAGVGMLEAVKPRLERIVQWFDRNTEVFQRWRNTLQRIGREAAEGILNWLEGAFRYLDTHYFSNPEFERLDLAGKISYVWTDLTKSFNAWWDEEGKDKMVELGKTIGGAMLEGISTALGGLAGLVVSANVEAVKNPNSENVKRALGTDILAGLLFGRAVGPMFRGGKWLVTKLWNWAAPFLGLGGAAAAGGRLAATAATAGSAAGAAAGGGATEVAGSFGAAAATAGGGAAATALTGGIAAAGAVVAGAIAWGLYRGFKYGDWSFLHDHGTPPLSSPGESDLKPYPAGQPRPFQPIINVNVDARGADAEEIADKVAAVVARKVGQIWENRPSLALGR